MNEFGKWLLPEGINEVLPPRSHKLEKMTRCVTDLFDRWGYNLVMPPMAEYLESFMLDNSDDLQIQTFKMTDPIGGRMLGVRPDITPQIARIDAHSLNQNDINRLCYIGQILNTKVVSHGRSRSPLQIGAELYGHNGIESNIEILNLMLKLFDTLGVNGIDLVLGHVGIYLELVKVADLSAKQSHFLAGLMRTKSKYDIKEYLESQNIDQKYRNYFIDLVDCYGDLSILNSAQEQFGGISENIAQALRDIQETADILSVHKGLNLHCDLLEAPGYHYEDGLVFYAFSQGFPGEIARGGRYDGIGRAFGRNRPAVGFSSDLEVLEMLSNKAFGTPRQDIFAPNIVDQGLSEAIAKARDKGDRVVVQLDENDTADKHNCTCHFVNDKGKWDIKEL